MNGFGASPLSKNAMLVNAIKYGFKTLITHPWLLCKAVFAVIVGFLIPLVALVFIVFALLPGDMAYSTLALAKMGFVAISFLVIGMGAWAGILRFVFELHDLGRAEIKTLFSGFGYVERLLGVSVFFSLISMLIMLIPVLALWKTGAVFGVLDLVRQGQWQMLLEAKTMNGILLVAACVVEIIVGVRLCYPWYLVIDQNLGVVDAFKRSWKLTQGFVLWLILLYIVMYLPGQILNIAVRFLMPVQLADQPYVEPQGAAVMFLVSFAVIVTSVCSMAAVFAHVRFYRLLQARR